MDMDVPLILELLAFGYRLYVKGFTMDPVTDFLVGVCVIGALLWWVSESC